MLTDISPRRGSGAYGSTSGITLVTLIGSNLNLTGPPRVKLGINRIKQLECEVTSTSQDEITFKTPPLPSNYDWVDKALQITLIWPSEGHPLTNGQLESGYTFTYLKVDAAESNANAVLPYQLFMLILTVMSWTCYL